MSAESQAIDRLLGDLVGSEHVSGLTNGQDDLFGVADISPVCFDDKLLLQTKISLHRTVGDWDAVAESLDDKENAVAICLIAVSSTQQLRQARALL